MHAEHSSCVDRVSHTGGAVRTWVPKCRRKLVRRPRAYKATHASQDPDAMQSRFRSLLLQGVVCGVVAQGTAKEPCGGLVISFLAGQILTSNTRALRTHAVSHDGTELHLLHVAALLPPQARLEHLEKALVTWRLIRRTASESFEDCMPNSERSPQATISIRAPRPMLFALHWRSDVSASPASARHPPQLSSQFESLSSPRKIQRYGQRHTRNDSVSFYVLSLHQHQRPLRHARRAVESGVRPLEVRLPLA